MCRINKRVAVENKIIHLTLNIEEFDNTRMHGSRLS